MSLLITFIQIKAAIEKAKAVYQKSLADAAKDATKKKAIKAGKRKLQEYEDE